MYPHPENLYAAGIQHQDELRQEVADNRLTRNAKRERVTCAASSDGFRFSHRPWLHQAYRGLLRRA